MSHRALMATLFTGFAFANLLQGAEPPKQVPLTAEELAKQLGIEHERWQLSFDEPVVAKMWVSETLASKTSTLADAVIREASRQVTYRLTIKRETNKESSGFDIAIDLEGDHDGEGEGCSIRRSGKLNSSWGFKHHQFDHGTPLGQEVVLFSWEQKLKSGRSPKADGNDEGLARTVEVKIRFSKVPPP